MPFLLSVFSLTANVGGKVTLYGSVELTVSLTLKLSNDSTLKGTSTDSLVMDTYRFRRVSSSTGF